MDRIKHMLLVALLCVLCGAAGYHYPRPEKVVYDYYGYTVISADEIELRYTKIDTVPNNTKTHLKYTFE